jgi:glycosyltransferase involved in cell wall biosynthesis
LLLTNCLADVGGGEVALLRHLDHSTMHSDRLAVALLNRGPLVQMVRERGVRCESIGRPNRDGFFPGWGETIQIAWRLGRLIRKWHISNVLCYTVPDLCAALIARYLVRFRLSWRSQGDTTVHLHQGANDHKLTYLLRKLGRKVDWIVSTTAWDAALLIEHGAVPDLVRTVYLGVDESWFESAPARVAAPPRVVISGRLVPWKGHLTFLQAFARVATLVPNAEAWIVGGAAAPYQAFLEQEAQRLGIGHRTRFWGHRSDVAELVRQCDIAVHCSEREPFGLVIIEAMSAGLPVIAAAVQGPREIIHHGETGYLVTPGDVEAYAQYMVRLLRDPDCRRQIGQAARRETAVRFRDSANVPELERLLLGGASRDELRGAFALTHDRNREEQWSSVK